MVWGSDKFSRPLCWFQCLGKQSFALVGKQLACVCVFLLSMQARLLVKELILNRVPNTAHQSQPPSPSEKYRLTAAMRKLTYIAMIRNPAGDVLQRTFEHECPEALLSRDAPLEQRDNFSRMLCLHYTDELFASAPFCCLICKQPAKRLIHHPKNYLPTPMVLDDNIQPVCHQEQCGIMARQLNQVYTRKLSQQLQQDTHQTRMCKNCGKKALQMCSRCRVEGYCSKACQQQHWPQHKRACVPDPHM